MPRAEISAEIWRNPMPKKRPEPYWRKQTKCFHVQLGKKQYRLDPDEKTAWKLYYELMANPPKAPDDIPTGEKADLEKGCDTAAGVSGVTPV
jgi:hypothetical protein